MANIPIWQGSASFSAGQTPYGFYDADAVFVSESVQVAKWSAYRLGYPIVDVELQALNFFAAFEEAVTTYGNEVYQYKIRENYLSMEGNLTGSAFNDRIITPNLGSTFRIAQTYAAEAGVGGFITQHTGSIDLTSGVQDYDLDALFTAQGITGSIEIKRVFFEQSPAITRFFDPFADSGAGMTGLIESFGWGSMSPAVSFTLMPIFFDVEKIQQIEFNDQIRRSGFSFDLINNKLRIFPIPNVDGRKLFLHYIFKDDRTSVLSADDRTNLVTDISKVPYNNPVFSQINAIGKVWIRQYALCLAKEMLGYIRGKYGTIPIPGSETTLNQSDLLTDARDEKRALLEQLRATLEISSRKTQLENQAAESDFIQKALINSPLQIYFF